MGNEWEKLTEYFDTSNGGPLYWKPHDGGYLVAGTLWMDGAYDGNAYFAFVAKFFNGYECDGVTVRDPWSACEMFQNATDPHVFEEIGWFPTCDAARREVKRFVGDLF